MYSFTYYLHNIFGRKCLKDEVVFRERKVKDQVDDWEFSHNEQNELSAYCPVYCLWCAIIEIILFNIKWYIYQTLSNFNEK